MKLLKKLLNLNFQVVALIFFIFLAFLPSASFASISECQVIASGTYTATATTSFARKLPRDARNGVYITEVTAASGTSPTLSVQYQQAYEPTAFDNGTNTITRGSITAASKSADLYVSSAVPQPLMAYHRAVLTIGGTTPSFTLTLKICYEN